MGIRNNLNISENNHLSLTLVLMSVISHNWKLQKKSKKWNDLKKTFLLIFYDLHKLNPSTDANSILLLGPIQFWRSCKIVFLWRGCVTFFDFFLLLFIWLPLPPPLTPARGSSGLTSHPSPPSPLNKYRIFDRGQTGWGEGQQDGGHCP